MAYLIEGSLEAKLPTRKTYEKHRRKPGEKVKEGTRTEEQVRKSQKKEDAGARKGRKVAKHLRSLLEVEMSKMCTPLCCEAHFQFKCTKHNMFRPPLEGKMSKKCTPLWSQAQSKSKCTKHYTFKAVQY